MFIDFRKLDDTPLQFDLCIIGAGPAGISIALAFENSPVRVCLVESGGFKLEKDTQSLCQGEVVGLPYWRPLEETRYRYFGGSTSSWGAWLAPLNEIDFVHRDWIPHSGWPISFAELESYYSRAQELSGVPSFNYDPDQVGYKPGALQSITHEGLMHRLWNFGAATRFGMMYRSRLGRAGNIRVVLHANVTDLKTDDTDTIVTGARVSTLEGKRSTVRAKVFVVATGGLEVPRLLLLSRMSDGIALGNRHDLVGRFFMEHPHIDIGTLVLSGDRRWVRNYQLRRIGRRVIRPHFCLSEGQQRKLRLVNCSCSLDIPDGDKTSYAALRRLRKNILTPHENSSLVRDLALAIANPLDVAFGVYSKLSARRYIPRKRIPGELTLRVRTEQIPYSESRVTLSEQRDALGLRRMRLDWRLDGEEKRTMRVMADFLASEFRRLRLGEVRRRAWLDSDEDGWPDDLRGGPHHMGTARMSDDPTQGVVDRNCRVHGTTNLFIGGSAVFPTVGYANPTLTIVALAVRLADHLKKAGSCTPTLIG
jgi:choline dehydrogenase-like flavoprotein